MKRHAYLALYVLAVIVSGCSSTPDYGCKAPDGTTCKSVSEVYRATEGPLRRVSAYADGRAATGESYRPVLATEKSITMPKIKPGDPLRVEPRILRIWLAPWEDEEEVFYDQSYIYVIVNQGRWLVSQNRNMLESNWRTKSLKPPKNRAQQTEPDSGGTAATQQQQSVEQTAANRAAARALDEASRKSGEMR